MAHVDPELRYAAMLLAGLPARRQRELLRLRPRSEQASLKQLIREVRAVCGGDPAVLGALLQRAGELSWPSPQQFAWASQQDPLWLRLLVHQGHPIATQLAQVLGEEAIAPPIEGELPAGLAEAVEALLNQDGLRPPGGAEPCA